MVVYTRREHLDVSSVRESFSESYSRGPYIENEKTGAIFSTAVAVEEHDPDNYEINLSEFIDFMIKAGDWYRDERSNLWEYCI